MVVARSLRRCAGLSSGIPEPGRDIDKERKLGRDGSAQPGTSGVRVGEEPGYEPQTPHSHVRSVREAVRATMMAEDARLLPSRDPLPAFDPKNPGLRVVQAGPVTSAAPATEPVCRNGAGRLTYDPAFSGLQDSWPRPAVPPAPVLPPALIFPPALVFPVAPELPFGRCFLLVRFLLLRSSLLVRCFAFFCSGVSSFSGTSSCSATAAHGNHLPGGHRDAYAGAGGVRLRPSRIFSGHAGYPPGGIGLGLNGLLWKIVLSFFLHDLFGILPREIRR